MAAARPGLEDTDGGCAAGAGIRERNSVVTGRPPQVIVAIVRQVGHLHDRLEDGVALAITRHFLRRMGGRPFRYIDLQFETLFSAPNVCSQLCVDSSA